MTKNSDNLLLSWSVYRRVDEVGHSVEPRRMPRIGGHEVRDVGERHPARRVGPRIGRAGAAVAEGLRRADRAEAADAVAVAADMRPQAAVHRSAVHRVVAPLAGMAARDVTR